MDRDRQEGAAKTMMGRLKDFFGRMTGDTKLQAEVALLARALWQEGYSDHISGHISYKQSDGSLLVNPYHLRWDAPNETAYPSTFAVDRGGVVRYALVSKSHGGRAEAEEVLKALGEASSPPSRP